MKLNETRKDLYRFDSAYGKIYKLSDDESCYFYLGTFAQYNVTKKDSYIKAVAKVEKQSLVDDLLESEREWLGN